jgi:hypothetical protein
MNETKHYNIYALRGDVGTTDEDVCAMLGLDPNLAGTPAINEAAIRKMHKENYDGYVAKGVDPTEALLLADKRAADVRKTIKQLK